MEKSVRSDKVTTMRGRERVRPSSGMASCDAVGAAVEQPGVGSTAATVQRLIMRYYNNVAFRFKIVFLIIALALDLTGRWRTMREAGSKLSAIVSIVLWTCVVLGGRAIADFDI